MFNDPSLSSSNALDCTETRVEPQGQSRDRLTDALARNYLVRVIAHAKRLARRLPAHISLNDLISAGMLGLVEGYLRYDPSRAETLDAFLDHRIRGALLDELRRNDPLTRAQRGFADSMGYHPTITNAALEGEVATRLALPDGAKLMPAPYPQLSAVRDDMNDWWRRLLDRR